SFINSISSSVVSRSWLAWICRYSFAGWTTVQQGIATMSLTEHAASSVVGAPPARGDARSAVEAFWARAALSKLEAKFAVAKEMDALPRLSIQALRAIALQYRYFTQAFVTDLALLVARCPEGGLRSLIGQL